MIRSILIFIAVFVGCEKVHDDTYTNRSFGPDSVYSEIHYEYSFGHFAARSSDQPKIDAVVLDADRENWPILWRGEKPINFRFEDASSLQAKFGDELKEVLRNGPGYDFGKVLGYPCDVFLDQEGRLRRVYTFSTPSHGPRISNGEESEILALPCTPAELEKCFGKPLRVVNDAR